MEDHKIEEWFSKRLRELVMECMMREPALSTTGLRLLERTMEGLEMALKAADFTVGGRELLDFEKIEVVGLVDPESPHDWLAENEESSVESEAEEDSDESLSGRSSNNQSPKTQGSETARTPPSVEKKGKEGDDEEADEIEMPSKKRKKVDEDDSQEAGNSIKKARTAEGGGGNDDEENATEENATEADDKRGGQNDKAQYEEG
jgi:hypothetical protein